MFGKGSLVHVFFQPPFNHVRMSLELGTFPYQGKKSPQSMLNLSPCVGIAFPVSDSTLLCSASLCHTAPAQPHCHMCPLWGENRVLLMQHKKGTGRLITLNQLSGGTHRYGIQMPTTEASSVSSLCECLTVVCLFVCFFFQLWYQDAMGTNIWTSIPVNRQQMPLAPQCQFLSLELNNLQLPLSLGMFTHGTQPLSYEEASSHMDRTCAAPDEVPITTNK